MRIQVSNCISTETAPIQEITIFKVYQTQEDFKKDYPNETEIFDPSLPEKPWIDPLAFKDRTENPWKLYRYLIVKNPAKGSPYLEEIVIPAYLAGRVNIPPKQGANEINPALGIIDTPVRALHQEEVLEKYGPMGIPIVVNTRIRKENEIKRDGFFASDRKLLLNIISRLDKLENMIIALLQERKDD